MLSNHISVDIQWCPVSQCIDQAVIMRLLISFQRQRALSMPLPYNKQSVLVIYSMSVTETRIFISWLLHLQIYNHWSTNILHWWILVCPSLLIDLLRRLLNFESTLNLQSLKPQVSTLTTSNIAPCFMVSTFLVKSSKLWYCSTSLWDNSSQNNNQLNDRE